MPRLSFVSLLLLCLALCSGCSQRSADQLVVGMELAYPPFEMTDEKGEPVGVSVDLARDLAAHLGKKLVIENIPFDGLIPSLKTGKIDLIISSMTATQERSVSIDFSEPYLHTGLSLLIAKDSPVQTIADLDAPERIVAVKKGTTGHLYASNQIRSAQVRPFDQESACVLEVSQGKADVFIFDQLSTLKSWQENRAVTRAALEPFQQEYWAVGLRKGNDDLRAKVNAFLTTYRTDGGFTRLGDKWLAAPKAEFTRMGVPFVF